MFFQNVFENEFRQSMVLSDRQYNITFSIKGNKNQNDLARCWNDGPFNLTGNNTLTVNFSLDNGKYYSAIAVTLTNSSGVTADTIVASLNANASFAAWFLAFVDASGKAVGIRTLKSKLNFRWYVSNTSAETILRFNKKAPVVELPSYFVRYTITEAPNYPEWIGQLILLDEGDAVDQAIITEAGLDYTAMKEDWQLLAGRSETFKFTLNTFTGDNLTQSIEFPAGASAGDLALMTKYVWSTHEQPDKIYQLPYVLTSSDISAANPP